MKSFAFILAVLLGTGFTALASADCSQEEKEGAQQQQQYEGTDGDTVMFWRYEMVTITPRTDLHRPYAIDRHHPEHPANRDRIYHRTVVIELPQTDMYNAGYDTDRNVNPVRQL